MLRERASVTLKFPFTLGQAFGETIDFLSIDYQQKNVRRKQTHDVGTKRETPKNNRFPCFFCKP